MSESTAFEITYLLLENVGQTPEQVAKGLTSRGILGVRDTTNELNPVVAFVARYVREQVSGVVRVDLVRGTVRFWFPNNRKVQVAVPAPVRQFLAAFNKGRFPQVEISRGLLAS